MIAALHDDDAGAERSEIFGDFDAGRAAADDKDKTR